MCLVEVVDGRVVNGNKLVAMASGEGWEVGEVGLLAPEPTPTGELLTGQVRRWGGSVGGGGGGGVGGEGGSIAGELLLTRQVGQPQGVSGWGEYIICSVLFGVF